MLEELSTNSLNDGIELVSSPPSLTPSPLLTLTPTPTPALNPTLTPTLNASLTPTLTPTRPTTSTWTRRCASSTRSRGRGTLRNLAGCRSPSRRRGPVAYRPGPKHRCPTWEAAWTGRTVTVRGRAARRRQGEEAQVRGEEGAELFRAGRRPKTDIPAGANRLAWASRRASLVGVWRRRWRSRSRAPLAPCAYHARRTRGC